MISPKVKAGRKVLDKELLEALAIFASTPHDNGDYPSDLECEVYARLFRHLQMERLVSARITQIREAKRAAG